MGHGQARIAVCAEGGICGISPRPDRTHTIGSYVLRGAGCNDCEDHLASLHYRSGRILTFGWTMTCKWGHAVATLPSDGGGDYTSLSQHHVNSANRGSDGVL
eukprot:6208181-Pleurochrysis_carterae.AAC.3